MEKKSNRLIVKLGDEGLAPLVANHIVQLLDQQNGHRIRPLVVLCIGSDRYTGDSLGPLVGSLLTEQGCSCIIFGTLDHPVHAGNLVETINIINARYVHPLIVAVDACLGKPGEVGNIEIWEGGMEAGVGVGNRLPRVGDISIVGVVNSGGCFGYSDLQCTPLAIVVKLSKVIGHALAAAISLFAATEAAVSLSNYVSDDEKACPT
jgi:putative sporulation protein YyaC